MSFADEVAAHEAQSQPKAPGGFAALVAQHEAASPPASFAQTAAAGLPAGQSAMDISQGKNPYSLEPEGQARAAGDIGGLAGAGALAATTGGMAIPVLGVGALANAALEKTGWGPYARDMGQRITSADKVAPFAESSNPIIKAAQYAKSMGAQIPATAESASWEAAPQIASQLALMVPGALKPGAPKPIPAGAQALENAGADVTPAMRGSSIGKMMETSARLDPLTVGKMEKVDTSVHDAARSIAQKHFGPDILEGNPPKQGEVLQGALDKMADQRAQAYAPALEGLKGKPSKAIGQGILAAVDSLKADETLSPRAIDAFKASLADEMKGSQTALGIDKALTRVKDAFKSKLAPGENGLSNQQTHDFNTIMNKAKDAYYSGLGKVGEQVRAAKGDYAHATQGMEPLGQALQARLTDAPEKIGTSILTQGSGAVKNLLANADPATATTIKQSLAHSIVREAINADGDISGPTLKSLVNKRFKDVMPALGEEGAKIKELADAMEAGGIAKLSKTNPSGTGLANSIGATGAGLGLAGGAALAGHPAALGGMALRGLGDLAYAHGGTAIQNMARTAQTGLSRIPTPQTPLGMTYQMLLKSLGVK